MRPSHRLIGNSIAGASLSAGLIGGIAPGILRLLDWLDLASSLLRAMSLFEDPRINWQGVWIVVSLLAASALVAVNWSVMRGALKARSKAKRGGWDISGADAVRYIAAESLISPSLPANASQRAAAAALLEAAGSNKIKLAGCRAGGGVLERIPPRSLRKMRAVLSDDGASLNLYKRGDLTPTYASVLCEKYAILEQWPPAPRPLSWMAR